MKKIGLKTLIAVILSLPCVLIDNLSAKADYIHQTLVEYSGTIPQNIFDLGGIYPLKMKVVGILKPNQTADDLAIFTDLKTTWIIEGLGHGHLDLVKSGTPDVVLKRDSENIAANAKLQEYNEINADNLDSFHFHGAQDDFPITGIIAIFYVNCRAIKLANNPSTVANSSKLPAWTMLPASRT